MDGAGNGDSPLTVAIAGGGISGLCLALGILNHAPHIRIHIYEAAARFSEIGAGVAFGINAQRALYKLDPRVGAAYAELHTSSAALNINHAAEKTEDRRKETYIRLVMGMDHRTNRDFPAGKEVCEVFCEGGSSSVHRARYLDAMVALLPEEVKRDCISFGKKLEHVEVVEGGVSGVKLLFADGSTAKADAVIGCDGIKSQLRQALLGRDSPAAHPQFTGKYAYRGLIPMAQAAAALGPHFARNGHHHVGYGGHVLTFPIDHGATMNVVAFRTQADGVWPAHADWTLPTTKAAMFGDFAGWGPHVHAILGLMDKCDKWAIFDLPPASTYHDQGRICLIGDAAHASSPHHGSGAGMGVEDAFVLSSLLGCVREAGDLRDVFAAFEATRKERTQRLVVSSREQGTILDLQGEGIRDDVGEMARRVPRRWDWIWDHDLDAEVAEAKRILEAKRRG